MNALQNRPECGLWATYPPATVGSASACQADNALDFDFRSLARSTGSSWPAVLPQPAVLRFPAAIGPTRGGKLLNHERTNAHD
jgi:hypothetical protein